VVQQYRNQTEMIRMNGISGGNYGRGDADGIIRNEITTKSNPVGTDIRSIVVDDDSSTTKSESSGLNVSAVLHALRRNWLLGSVLGLLLAVPLAVAVWSIHKLEYKARAQVRISPQQARLLFETADQAVGSANFKSYKNTQRQLILSPHLLNNALKKETIKNLPIIRMQIDPIAWLQKQLEINFPDDAEIMQVALASAEPQIAQKVVDAVVSTYYDEVVVAEQNERLRRVDSLERVQTDAENKARAKRAELRGLVDTLGSGDSSTLNLAQQATVQHYSLIRAELSKIQFDLMRAEGELQFKSQDQLQKQEAEPATGTPESTAPAEVRTDLATLPVTDPRLTQLIEADSIGSRHLRDVERFTNLIQVAETRLASTTASAYVDKYREQLDQSQKKLNDRTIQLQDMLLESRSMGGTTRDIPRLDLPREIEILKTQERRLDEELKRVDAEAKKIGRSTIDVEMMRTEVIGLDKVVSHVAEELERTKIELKANSRTTILGPAQVPQVGESKRRLPLTAAAGLFGLFAPLMLLMGFDLSRQLVNGTQSLSNHVTMPVLGSLPLVPRNMMKRLGNLNDSGAAVWRRRLHESVSAVTSLLLRKLEQEGHRVILITSATSGEGKSTLAEQLASSLADSGHRTLLIDFDLRRPKMHIRFDARMEPGVTDVLRNGTDLEDAVIRVDSPNMSVLTAGGANGSLLQDAANGSLRALFVQARANYEIVIVDSCPLLPVVDGRLIGQFTDGAILSAIKDVSKLPTMAAARAILNDYGVPVLGCVVTGSCTESYYMPDKKSELEPALA
jgi:succinoglycan biosynthesis transport protein ExoP